MSLEFQLLAALGLDLAAGDPRWLPHPVRFIGRLAAHLESSTRGLLPARLAGVATVIVTVGVTGVTTWTILHTAIWLHPAVGNVVAVLLLWTTLAARDLADHATDVGRALARGELAAARERVGRIVGRDTERLDEPEVVRATVETVAENTTDGVIAPLFYACLFGPVGAMVYKAINTLDSTFGYKNERYLLFGWASARLDDIASFLPARLTAPLLCLAAGVAGLHPLDAFRIFLRDGRRHPSPNAGLTEAAMAGALGVALGGTNHYFGQPSSKPILGDARTPLGRRHIGQAIRLMLLTSIVGTLTFLGVRFHLLRAMGGLP